MSVDVSIQYAGQGSQNAHSGDQGAIVSADEDNNGKDTSAEMSVNIQPATDHDESTASDDESSKHKNTHEQYLETDQQSQDTAIPKSVLWLSI